MVNIHSMQKLLFLVRHRMPVQRNFLRFKEKDNLVTEAKSGNIWIKNILNFVDINNILCYNTNVTSCNKFVIILKI